VGGVRQRRGVRRRMAPPDLSLPLLLLSSFIMPNRERKRGRVAVRQRQAGKSGEKNQQRWQEVARKK